MEETIEASQSRSEEIREKDADIIQGPEQQLQGVSFWRK
jgi:hypothetical protein